MYRCQHILHVLHMYEVLRQSAKSKSDNMQAPAHHFLRSHIYSQVHSRWMENIVLWIRHIGLSFFICYIDTLHHDVPSYRSRQSHVFLAQLSSQSLYLRVPSIRMQNH
jgi:uncharacterized protein YfbU (UPF0304 family)